MPNRLLIIVVAALALLGGSWLWLADHRAPTAESEAGQRLFPGLEGKLNGVKWIRVEHRGEVYDVLKQGDQWQLPGKGGYPVLFERVKPLLLGIAQLEKVEPQTDKPQEYARLGVQAPSGDSDNWRLSLYTGANTPVASLIVGRIRTGLIAGGRDGIHVRAEGEARTWLAAGNLDLPEKQVDWVNRRIIHIKPVRVKRVTIRHPDGDVLMLAKPRRGAPDFAVVNLPKGAALKPGIELNPLARSLAGLNMDDVLVRAKAGLPEADAVSAVFETWDGLKVTARTVERDGHIYAWFDVGAAALDSSDLAGVRTVQEESGGLKSRLAGWVFEIPRERGERLRARLDAMLRVGATRD